jgi:5'-deoxynucleotidase YfbR-like HD superfamily hydrolase
MKDYKNLLNLFKLVQVTRTQPQYGYALSNLKKHELSNLAEHQYLVTFIALQLSKLVNSMGGKIISERVMEICLVHDLGELFGGDISRPYAMANPKARKLAKAFEEENQKFLRRYFPSNDPYLWDEVMKVTTDEGKIAKLADIFECAHFLEYINQFKPLDQKILEEKIPALIKTIKDIKSRNALAEFSKVWLKTIHGKNITEILFE